MGTEALLVMDVQTGIVDRYLDDAGPLLGALSTAVDAARAAGIPVVYVRIGFRDGAPEVSARNQGFAAIRSMGGMGEDDADTQVHPAVAPQPGDIVVMKRRVSAFSGSDLDVVLRSLDVDSLVLTGIATGGVVLSTLREAADRDFGLTVLRDGCADNDPEVQRVLLDTLFPRQASVVTTDEWRAGLAARA